MCRFAWFVFGRFHFQTVWSFSEWAKTKERSNLSNGTRRWTSRRLPLAKRSRIKGEVKNILLLQLHEVSCRALELHSLSNCSRVIILPLNTGKVIFLGWSFRIFHQLCLLYLYDVKEQKTYIGSIIYLLWRGRAVRTFFNYLWKSPTCKMPFSIFQLPIIHSVCPPNFT